MSGKNLVKLKSCEILLFIRSTVDFIRKSQLGFTGKEVGTYSIRSTFAMILYLQEAPVYKIMLLCHWSSVEFLLYILIKVLEFSKGIRSGIIYQDILFTIPYQDNKNQDAPRNHNQNFFASHTS